MARGKTLLKDTHPDLEREWDALKNPRPFAAYATYSHEKAWWRCELGHSYSAMVSNRAKGRGCGYCAGKQVLAGFNDLASQNPALALEWDLEANGLPPEEVHAGSHGKFFWKCHLGHSWQASVANRGSASNRTGCPVCSGQKLLSGFNDLLTLFPSLREKWDFERNSEDPTALKPSYAKSVWWKCSACGGGWRRKPELEARRATTLCSSCLRGSSLFEQAVGQALVEIFPEERFIFNSKKLIPPYELDVVLPSRGLALELNGEYWHGDHSLSKRGFASAEAYHSMKRERCQGEGLKLAYLWEDDWRTARQEVLAELQHFVATGECGPLLSRLRSNHTYSPAPKPETSKEVATWAASHELSIEHVPSEVGSLLLIGGKLALGVAPQAPSSEALRSLQREYAELGLPLFFAYPWDSLPLLLSHLESKLGLATRSFAAKRLALRELPNKEADAFVREHHLQGAATGSQKVSLGLYGPADELLAVQQYAKYRFKPTKGEATTRSSKTWEGLRLCFKPGVRIHGGATRLQKFFVENYSPARIVSYVDLSHSLGTFKQAQHFTLETSGGESYRWVLEGEPVRVPLRDREGRLRTNSLERARSRPVLNPNQVAGAFGKGVGRLFYGGPLGSRQELEQWQENGELTHNDAILEAMGYRKYFTAGQQKWSWTHP